VGYLYKQKPANQSRIFPKEENNTDDKVEDSSITCHLQEQTILYLLRLLTGNLSLPTHAGYIFIDSAKHKISKK